MCGLGLWFYDTELCELKANRHVFYSRTWTKTQALVSDILKHWLSIITRLKTCWEHWIRMCLSSFGCVGLWVVRSLTQNHVFFFASVSIIGRSLACTYFVGYSELQSASSYYYGIPRKYIHIDDFTPYDLHTI